MFYMTDDIRDRFYDFYKDDESDQIWSVSEIEEYGRWLFTFDCKKIYNFYEDYPDALTPEEKAIFDEWNPVMAELWSPPGPSPIERIDYE